MVLLGYPLLFDWGGCIVVLAELIMIININIKVKVNG